MFSVLSLALLAMAAPEAAPSSATSTRSPDEKICRRYVETGSRVKGRNVCKTRAEWAASDDAERESSTRMLEQIRLRTGNN